MGLKLQEFEVQLVAQFHLTQAWSLDNLVNLVTEVEIKNKLE